MSTKPLSVRDLKGRDCTYAPGWQGKPDEMRTVASKALGGKRHHPEPLSSRTNNGHALKAYKKGGEVTDSMPRAKMGRTCTDSKFAMGGVGKIRLGQNKPLARTSNMGG